MKRAIARRTIPLARGRHVLLELASPRRMPGAPDVWSCTVALSGAVTESYRAFGDDSLQALQLAIDFAGRLLEARFADKAARESWGAFRFFGLHLPLAPRKKARRQKRAPSET